MRTLLAALSVLLLQPVAATSQEKTPESATTRSSVKARQVLNAAAQAHGGLDKLRGLKGLHRTGKAKTYTQGQGLGPDAPPIEREVETEQWLDFAGSRVRTENKLQLAGLPLHTRAVLSGDAGYGWNAATGASTRFIPTGTTGLKNTLRRDPARIVVNALARVEAARSLGPDTVDGKAQDVVAYADTDGTLLTLSFDSDTHLLTKVETLNDTAVLGDTLN